MAVEHLCFLVDVNKLYDNALGLYDINLTLLVAQQSQKVGLALFYSGMIQVLIECLRILENIYLFSKSCKINLSSA